jgi:hypothetical protein
MVGGVKSSARSCSKSHRICQIRPSTKPTAIAAKISRTITSNQVTAQSTTFTGCGGTCVVSANAKADVQNVLAGLNYKFNF